MQAGENLGYRFPARLSRLGSTLKEAQLRELIQYGIERARGYNITSGRDVTKFIDLYWFLAGTSTQTIDIHGRAISLQIGSPSR